MEEQSDFDMLITRCISGDHSAQRLLFKSNFSFAKNICVRYTKNSQDADDVLNEAFLKVFMKIQTYDPTCAWRPWLRSVVIHTAISYNRKFNRHRMGRTSFEDAPQIYFDDNILAEITAEEILDLIGKLRPVQKEVLLLYCVDGYLHKEIAAMLNMKECSVRSTYIRGKAKLKEKIVIAFPHLRSRIPSLERPV